MTNLDSVLKSRDITLPTKLHIVKAMVFPVVTYSCESWNVKKAEHQRIDVFKLWCWRRLLKVLWTARRSNQSILREINLEYSLAGLMLKMKLQYFGHLTRTDDSLERPLTLGKNISIYWVNLMKNSNIYICYCANKHLKIKSINIWPILSSFVRHIKSF